MPKIKPEFEDPRLPGERYMCEVPGPFEMDLEPLDEGDLWSIYTGSHQGRPCQFRLAAIADWYLEGSSDSDRFGLTLVGLFRYTSMSY